MSPPQAAENLSASVRQRLLNLSREQNTPFELMALHYATERFLFRLSKSSHTDQFILKGAMLFAVWANMPKRVTRDLDMLAFGDNDADSILLVIQAICKQPVPDDGLTFDQGSIQSAPIRELNAYHGFRIRFNAFLGKMKIPMQIDLGFGDAVTPEAQIIQYPGLLEFPVAQLRAYPPETVVAEKVQAIVHLGMLNSRMKDYYDLYVILSRFNLKKEELARALSATFKRRQTGLPVTIPLGLSDEFGHDKEKQRLWQQFIKRQQLDTFQINLEEIVDDLQKTLMPAIQLAICSK